MENEQKVKLIQPKIGLINNEHCTAYGLFCASVKFAIQNGFFKMLSSFD